MLRALQRFTRSGSHRWLLFTVLAAAAVVPYVRTAGAFNEFRDAQVLWSYEDSARRSVLDFFQLPLWDPDLCGGLPGLGTPQSRFASPTFLLTLLFGTSRAEPLTLFAMVLLALFGAHRYARSHGARQLGATLGAPLFGLMGVFACAPFLGWFGFLGFALLPWLLSGLRDAARGRPRGVVLVAVSAAFIVGFGGTYVAPISLVACALEGMLLLAQRRRVRWLLLAEAGLLALGLSAFRLWAVWEELRRGPRLISGYSSVDWQALGGHVFGGWPPASHETWYLVTIPGALAALFSLSRRRGRWLLPLLAVWVWLSAGYAATPSLFALLRHVPVFSLLRSAERFLVPAALLLSVGAAFSVDDASVRCRLRQPPWWARPAWAFTLACLGLAVPLLIQNFFLAANARTLSAPPAEVRQAFHQSRGNRWAAASFGPMSRGSLACWEAYGVPQSKRLRGDLEEEAWLAEKAAGSLEETGWSPQRLDFNVHLQRPTRVLVNQNFHRGWRSSVGTVVSDEGLLAVELPAGDHAVRLRFLPTSAVGGFTVSALALAVLLFRGRGQWSGWQRGLLAALPLVAGLGVATVRPEPPGVAAPAEGPEGETLFVKVLPAGSTHLGVRFGGDVVLEGASVAYRPGDDRVRLELDWSRGGAVNAQLGVFVHIEPGGLKRITADHLQVSDKEFLERIPVGMLARDILLIDVPKSKRDVPWTVWVGLWEMRGTGDRLPVLVPNGAAVVDNRVRVGMLFIR